MRLSQIEGYDVSWKSMLHNNNNSPQLDGAFVDFQQSEQQAGEDSRTSSKQLDQKRLKVLCKLNECCSVALFSCSIHTHRLYTHISHVNAHNALLSRGIK